MGSYSQIERDYRHDERYRTWTRTVRQVWDYLLCNPHMNDGGDRIGAYVLDPYFILTDLACPDWLPTITAIEDAMELLHQEGRIVWDPQVRVVLLRNFWKHRQPANPNILKAMVSDVAALPFSETVSKGLLFAARKHLLTKFSTTTVSRPRRGKLSERPTGLFTGQDFVLSIERLIAERVAAQAMRPPAAGQHSLPLQIEPEPLPKPFPKPLPKGLPPISVSVTSSLTNGDPTIPVSPPPRAPEETPAVAATDDPTTVEQAMADMSTELNVVVNLWPDARRTAFRTAMRPVILGHERIAWRDPRGDGSQQIPWEDRPRLFSLALAKITGDGMYTLQAFTSALVYVAKRDLTPYPMREKPPAGSEAAAFHGDHRKPELPQSSAPRGDGLTPVGNGAPPTDEEDERVEAWAHLHPDIAEQVRQSVAAEFELSQAYWDKLPRERAEQRFKEVCIDRLKRRMNERGVTT